MKLADVMECSAGASGEEEVEGDDGDGEDDADETLGENVESAGSGEEVAIEAVVAARTGCECCYLSTAPSTRFAPSGFARDDKVWRRFGRGGKVGGSRFFGTPEGVEGKRGPKADGGVG